MFYKDSFKILDLIARTEDKSVDSLSIAGGSIILLYKIQSSLHHGLKLESYHGKGHGDRKSPARWLKKLIK